MWAIRLYCKKCAQQQLQVNSSEACLGTCILVDLDGSRLTSSEACLGTCILGNLDVSSKMYIKVLLKNTLSVITLIDIIL